MPYDFGDVVLVPFPFSNQKAFKKRPAVIVNSKAYNAARPDVIIMAITSRLGKSGTPGEVLLSNWQGANLLNPSAIKPVFATLEARLVLSQLGSLDAHDQAALRAPIAGVLG